MYRRAVAAKAEQKKHDVVKSIAQSLLEATDFKTVEWTQFDLNSSAERLAPQHYTTHCWGWIHRSRSWWTSKQDLMPSSMAIKVRSALSFNQSIRRTSELRCGIDSIHGPMGGTA
jgi:hypothetical protein